MSLKRFSFLTVFLALLGAPASLFAQTDTLGSGMSFDLGWTRNRNILLWPVFKRSVSPTEQDVQALFPLFRHRAFPGKGVDNLRLAPLFVHEHQPGRRDLRLGTLYFPSVFRTIRDSVQGYRSLRVLELYEGIGLYGRSRSDDGLREGTNLLWVYVYQRDRLLQRSHRVLVPLYWDFQSPQRHSRLLLPLYGRLRTDSAKTLFVSPLWWQGHVQRRREGLLDTTAYKVLFPLYWDFRSGQWRTQVFGPLYGRTLRGDSSSAHMISPLIWHKKQKQYSQLLVLPFYWKTKSPTRTLAQSWPLFRYEKTVSTSAPQAFKRLTLLLLYARQHEDRAFRAPKGTSRRAIYSEAEEETEDTLARDSLLHRSVENRWRIFPLAYAIDHGRHVGDTLVDTSRRQILFPLYWNTWRQQTSRGTTNTYTTKVLFPLFWDIRRPGYRTLSIQPFFSLGYSTDSSRKHVAITPLMWTWRHDTEHLHEVNRMVFPLWWQGREERTNGSYRSLHRYQVLFPVYWHFRQRYSRSTDHSAHVLFPLVWVYRTSDSVARHTNWVVFPLVWRYSTPSFRSFTFLPLFSYGADTAGRRQHVAITPLFWKGSTPKKTYTLGLPLWYSIQHRAHIGKFGRTDVFFPLYWRVERRQYAMGQPERRIREVVFPVYWSLRQGQEKRQLFFPLYYHQRDRDSLGQHATVAFPLYWHFWGNKQVSDTQTPYQQRVLFPFYWAMDDRFSHTRALFPFYYRKTTHDSLRTWNVLGILFTQTTHPQYRKWSALWPVLGVMHSERGRYYHVLPLVWRRKEDSLQYLAIFPLYYHRRTPTVETYRIAWDLYTTRRTKGLKHHRSFLWKTIYWDRYDNGDRTLRILYRLYARVDRDGRSERSAFPFYHRTWDTEGNRSHSYLFHFYTRSQQALPNTREVYREVRIFWLLRLVSNYEYLQRKGLAEGVRRRKF